MYWLDLVRYADTVGYHGDQDHHASPYRDYVIDAFNAEHAVRPVHPRATRRRPAAEADRRPEDRDRLQPPAADVARGRRAGRRSTWRSTPPTGCGTSSAVWMGATVGCAECHDHKFDPYTAKDFYALAAFFADVDEEKHLRGGGGRRRPDEAAAGDRRSHTRRERERLAALDARIAELEKRRRRREEAELGGADEGARRASRRRTRLVMVTQARRRRGPSASCRAATGWTRPARSSSPAVPAFLGKLAGDGRGRPGSTWRTG